MSQIELSYEDTKLNMIEEIKKRQFMVLATSEEDYVMARTVVFIPEGLSVFFMMRPATRKYTQIEANPNVAVADGNLQIEGVASSRGHPFAEQNTKIMEIWKEMNPRLYENAANSYPKRPEIELIEVVPRRIALYKNPAFDNVSEPYWHILYVDAKKAFKVKQSEVEDATVYRK